MTLSHPILRALAAAVALAFAAGCSGGTNMMQPQVPNVAPTDVAAETTCAGDLCFTYADDND